jgi:predicted nucleotidyltransferase component of viral defense system
MAKKIKADIAASVLARLLAHAKKQNRDFNSILRLYTQERFLYRLSVSQWCDHFVLKGALLFLAFDIPRTRPTKDIDLLGQSLAPDIDNIKKIMKEVAGINFNDGVVFDHASVTAERIKEDQRYEGVRAFIEGKLGTARLKVQIDIGFGDVISFAPGKKRFPCLLEFAPLLINVYSKETAIAEKIEAIARLGMATSRMKDFYDIFHMARHTSFSQSRLVSAVNKTFAKRDAGLSLLNVFEMDDWKTSQDKRVQWLSFLKRHGLNDGPDFGSVVDSLNVFVKGIRPDTTSSGTVWNPQSWAWE